MRNKELKVRLLKEEYDRFTTACEQEHVSVSTKARELMLQYTQTILAPVFEPADQSVHELPALHSGALRVGEMFSGPGGIGIALNRAKSKHFSLFHKGNKRLDRQPGKNYHDAI